MDVSYPKRNRDRYGQSGYVAENYYFVQIFVLVATHPLRIETLTGTYPYNRRLTGLAFANGRYVDRGTAGNFARGRR